MKTPGDHTGPALHMHQKLASSWHLADATLRGAAQTSGDAKERLWYSMAHHPLIPAFAREDASDENVL